MKTGNVLLGVLAGAAVGATLGILFAPDKGSNTRRKISQKSTDYAEGLEDKFNEFIAGMTKQFKGMKDEATRLAEDGKEKMEDAGSDLVSAAKNKMKKSEDGVHAHSAYKNM